LRKAILDLPTNDKKPNILGVVSSLTDAQTNSPFYRFLESYVEENPDTQKKLWRFAPDAAAGEEDETIGIYDFNGYWNKGQLKMGLFDWFMRGYLDAAKTIESSEMPDKDPVLNAYNNIPEYGQLGNAIAKRESPGYFVVDFANNKPHPGYI
jgi:hypothetical protein